MDYFLTGATGSLGLSLVRLLLESSPETRLYCLVRNPEESPLRSEASGRIQLVQGDVTKPGLGLDKAVWDRLAGRIGRVVHMAANVDFLATLDEARALNVVGTRNVLDFARACLNRDSPHFGVLHVSTAYVCGKATGLLAEASLNPHGEFWNHYERTKSEAEVLVQYAASELPVTIVRPSQIVGDAGSGQVHKYFGFYEFVGLAMRSRSNVLVADTKARPDMIPVDYVSRGMLHLMQLPAAVGRTYHLAAGLQASLSVGAVVDLVLDLMSDMPGFKTRFGRPRVLKADELDAQLSPAERNAFEFSPQKLLLRSYASYLDYERNFDVAATQAVASAPRNSFKQSGSEMFSPSQADVRRFFCTAWRNHLQKLPMTALECLAADWIAKHPEYHAELADEEAAVAAVFDSKGAAVDRPSPFLHLSMHLSISEQTSIDQPRGIRQAVELLAARRGSLHEAHHEVMECLGTMLWQSQRSGRPPDGEAYIEAVRRRATASTPPLPYAGQPG